ncbi:hypothetical protein FQA39_LY02559 [Lamprigera yunnana]|nr:hypothetical protein FQA39_LY02559 [Lamprigera yunnana]
MILTKPINTIADRLFEIIDTACIDDNVMSLKMHFERWCKSDRENDGVQMLKTFITTCITNLVLIQIVKVKCECGGTLTEKKGLLQTPNFPNEFSVPIFCKWVIDSSEIIIPNTSIVVYLTQLFVLEGLSFEEYETYDRRYNIIGKQIHLTLENNISKVRWVRTNQNVLVITFQLQNIENTHLRILDHFLDVYGFNLTYEITSEPVRSDSCTMSDCGFTGTCFDNYTHFYCQCFHGYTGKSCSDGYNSLCSYDGVPHCKNNGKCRHVGTNAVTCDCLDGYVGEQCQKTERSQKQDCNEKNFGHNCKCLKEIGSVFIIKLPVGVVIKYFQIYASKLTAVAENVRVSSVNYYDWGTEATVYFNGLKRDKKKLENLITRWTSVGRIGNLTLIDKSIALRNESFHFLKNLTINQVGAIRKNGHFVLSCIAYGTPHITFRWYKDGLLINTTLSTSNKWIRLIASPQQNRFTSILGVDKISYFDEGLFVCEAEDVGLKQCLSRTVEITKPPIVKIEPMTLTVQKGENFTIKCICVTNKNHDHKYTYSWTKNKVLLPIKTDMEKYEILYPGGSILQVSHIEKTTVYSCLVQDEVTSTEVGIQIDVVDRNLIHTCRGEKTLNILWPETAPGTQNIQECPKGFSGTVQRWCVLHDADRSLWQLPDFSLCVADYLQKLDNHFQQLQLGYGSGNVSRTLESYNEYIKKRLVLLPGEGVRILSLANNAMSFINSSRDLSLISNGTNILFNIIDEVIKHENALINQEHVILLQNVLQNYLHLCVAESSICHKALNSINIDAVSVNSLSSIPKIPLEKQKYPPWFKYNLDVIYTGEVDLKTNESTIITCVVYKNLSNFLPMRSAIRLRDAAEMEYEIISEIATVWLLKSRKQVSSDKFSFVMEFSHSVVNTNMTKWRINCSVATYATYGYDWNIGDCYTILINATTTKCICSRQGTYSVLVTSMPLSLFQVVVEEYYGCKIFVLISCYVCLIFATISTLVLIAHWTMIKTSITFLKMQFCGVLSASMIMFVIALSKEIENELYPYVNTAIEIFLLIALSSHISKCLIVFADMVQLSKTQNLSKTIVAISTGVPVITVFASHLTHRTMGKRQPSWWLINGSVSFNIFVTAFLIIIFLYNVMYLMVMEKLSQCGDKPSIVVLERKKLLRRSFCIFWATVVTICSSIMYINMKESPYWNYAFALSNVLLVSIFFTSYILKSEIKLSNEFVERFKFNSTTKQSSSTVGSTSSSSKQDSEFASNKSDVGSTRQMGSSKSIILLSDLQNIPSYTKNLPPEMNNESSSSYNMHKPVKEYMYSPDVVATRVHVELDLVAPIIHDQNNKMTEDNPIILCNIAVNSRCEINSNIPDLQIQAKTENLITSERIQPEGVETLITDQNTEGGEQIKTDSLDGMLDKISHDLDYLLNRKGSIDKCTDNDEFHTSF